MKEKTTQQKKNEAKKAILTGITERVKEVLTLKFFDSHNDEEKNAIIAVCEELGHNELAMNLRANF